MIAMVSLASLHLSQYSEDSCGFEHVFVGEAKQGKEIMGLHNWVQFYLQEKLKFVDYKGYKSADKDKVCLSQSHGLTAGNPRTVPSVAILFD